MAAITIEIDDQLYAQAKNSAADEYGFNIREILADMLTDIAYMQYDEDYFSRRYNVLERFSDGEITAEEASAILDVSYEQMIMLMKVYALPMPRPVFISNNKVSADIQAKSQAQELHQKLFLEH